MRRLVDVQVAVKVQVDVEGVALARVRDVAQDGGERGGDEEEDRGEPGGGEEPQVVGGGCCFAVSRLAALF